MLKHIVTVRISFVFREFTHGTLLVRINKFANASECCSGFKSGRIPTMDSRRTSSACISCHTQDCSNDSHSNVDSRKKTTAAQRPFEGEMWSHKQRFFFVDVSSTSCFDNSPSRESSFSSSPKITSSPREISLINSFNCWKKKKHERKPLFSVSVLISVYVSVDVNVHITPFLCQCVCLVTITISMLFLYNFLRFLSLPLSLPPSLSSLPLPLSPSLPLPLPLPLLVLWHKYIV